MRYAGNLSESYAAHYTDRRYTHSTVHAGKEVRWYDCWSHADEARPTFTENLNIPKVRAIDRIFRDWPLNETEQ